MRLQAAFLLLASCIPSSWAIFADEAFIIDYHHALLGTPQAHATFFHRPSSSSSASLLYTLSDKSILGAVNPKDGSIVWRQNLSHPNGVTTSGGLLRAVEGENTVVSALGNEVSSWGASDGKLGWVQRFENSRVIDMRLVEAPNPAVGQTDSIVLFEKSNAFVRRLNGAMGFSRWEYKDESDDVPFQISTSTKSVFYISLSPVPRKGYKIKVTELDLESGRVVKQHILSSETDVTSLESILYLESNTPTPFIVWADKALNTLKVNIIGSKSIQSVDVDNNTGEEVQSVRIHASSVSSSQPHFAVQYKTESKSWTDVYHINPETNTISRAHRLPVIHGKSILAVSTKDGAVYFTRISDSEVTVTSSVSDNVLGRWTFQEAPKEIGLFAVSEVVTRESAVAVRFAQIEQSGDWHLVRNGKLEWSRPESLTEVVAMAWADVNGVGQLAHELEIEGHQTVLGAYTHRVNRHIKALQENFPTWWKDLPFRLLTSVLPGGNTDMIQFGFGKLAIVATRNGRVAALDSAHQGKVLWNTKVADVGNDNWSAKLITVDHGIATVYVDDGSSIKVDVSNGAVLDKTPATGKFKSIALLPGSTSTVPVGIDKSGRPHTSLTEAGTFIVSLSEDGRVLGWDTRNVNVPVWEFSAPNGQKIIDAIARPPHDPVASIGKVLGNRSVLYKYLNPNNILVTAVGDSTVSFHLLDGVSGQVLHTMSHDGVDISQPIASVVSENWFAYSFWADVTETSEAKGYQLVISELYESPIVNDRGPLGDARNYSSIRSDRGLPRPYVISQAYIVPEAISNMAVTQTRQGITIRRLLCTLPAANAIVGIPRPVLDPRRPVGRDPTPQEVEEGLTKYSPVLDFDPRWYLTHAREVSGIQRIESSPTLLESTTLIFAYGFDIFGTRLAPSQTFDILGKGFSKVQLLLTIVALAAGVAMLAPMARRKQVNLKWKA
ncbi:hypothetical protein VTO42DRAFT_4002 [Malbranchea cinnamomea]